MCHPLKVMGALLVLTAALSACSRFSLLNQPLEKPVDVEVRSLREGGTVRPGDAVKILLHSEEEGPFSLQIRLTDMSGKAVWESTVEAPSLNEELELELVLPEDLALGQYELVLQVTGESGTASERRVAFFYTPGEYRILGIQSYPPSLVPGTSTVLKAQLKVPDGANPFLRWTLADRVVARGSLHNGFDQITWSAPEQEGIYTVRVELFPVAPVGGVEYPFKASAFLEAQLYVTHRKAITESDLTPEASYYSLYHFNGDLADSAPGAVQGQEKPPEATPIGAPRLVVVQQKMGYQIQEGSGLRLPRWPLPLAEGVLRPFTLTMGLILQASGSPRDLLTVQSREGDFLFQVRTGPKELSAHLQAGEQATDLPSGFTEPADGREHFVSLSVEPYPTGLRLRWFLDGRQTADWDQALVLPALSGAGECRVGGTGGFAGVITELGVYFKDEQDRPAIDPAVYRRAMEDRHRSTLLIADGFDGMFLAPELKSQGAARLQRGELALPGAGSLGLPTFDLDAEGLSLELALAGELPPQARVRLFWSGAAEPFAEVTAAGTLAVGGRELGLAGSDLHLLQLALGPAKADAAGLTLRVATGKADRQHPLPAPAAGTAGLQVRIENPAPADAAPLLIDRVLVLRGRDLF